MASSISTCTSPLLLKTLTLKPHKPPPISFSPFHLRLPPKTLTLRSRHSSLSSDTPITVHYEDLVEKDWSFIDDPSSDEEWDPKARRIISAAAIDGQDRTPRALVSFAPDRFVDRLVEDCSFELLLAIHDSLFALAMIKERHDEVRCWQGPVAEVPERFWPFDAVFVCYFPAMGVSVEELLDSLAGRLSPGARVVISLDQGREVVDQVHREQHPDMVTSELPTRDSLETAATSRPYKLIDFVDDPTLYLAVLEFCKL